MSGEKLNFRSQPTVKSIFVYRNGDAHTEARRVLIHEKRVSDFETLLCEVTGRVRAPFGAVRCIYTPTAGHRVDALEHVRHGEQYVAAGTEKFKKLEYLQISSRKKQKVQNNGLVKAAPQTRIVVSPRFLKPIKEPCAIYVIANGDVLNPAVRFLVPNRLLGQFERILEMITEKMGLRILGGVHSLCSLEGVPIMDGRELESGQFYVAVGRDRFKRLPYAESLYAKPAGARRIARSKAASLPPIYKYTRQNEVAVNDVSKANGNDGAKPSEAAASLVRQISRARLMAIRKKRSSLTKSYSTQDNDDADPKPDGEDVEREEKAVQEENSSADQVCGSEEAAAGEEEAVVEEEEESPQEEEEAGAEGEEAGEEEEESPQEEAGAEGEEAGLEEAGEEEEVVAEAETEEEAEAEKEEAVAETVGQPKEPAEEPGSGEEGRDDMAGADGDEGGDGGGDVGGDEGGDGGGDEGGNGGGDGGGEGS